MDLPPVDLIVRKDPATPSRASDEAAGPFAALLKTNDDGAPSAPDCDAAHDFHTATDGAVAPITVVVPIAPNLTWPSPDGDILLTLTLEMLAPTDGAVVPAVSSAADTLADPFVLAGETMAPNVPSGAILASASPPGHDQPTANVAPADPTDTPTVDLAQLLDLDRVVEATADHREFVVPNAAPAPTQATALVSQPTSAQAQAAIVMATPIRPEARNAQNPPATPILVEVGDDDAVLVRTAPDRTTAMPANPTASSALATPVPGVSVAASPAAAGAAAIDPATTMTVPQAVATRERLTEMVETLSDVADPAPLKTADTPVVTNDNATRTAGGANDIEARARATNQPVLHQVVVHVARAAADGSDRISIKLVPADLGRIDVQLEFGPEGRVQAVFAADRPHTLDLLQRDARALERALNDMGLRADSGSLSFSLRDERRDGQAFNAFSDVHERDAPPLAEHAAASLALTSAAQIAIAPGRIDIRI